MVLMSNDIPMLKSSQHIKQKIWQNQILKNVLKFKLLMKLKFKQRNRKKREIQAHVLIQLIFFFTINL